MISTNTLTMEIIWKKLLYNKFRFGLHPQMLSPEGYRKKIVVAVENTQREKKPYTVVFDREYVVEYLKRTVINPLNPMDAETIIELISDATKKAN